MANEDEVPGRTLRIDGELIVKWDLLNNPKRHFYERNQQLRDGSWHFYGILGQESAKVCLGRITFIALSDLFFFEGSVCQLSLPLTR